MSFTDVMETYFRGERIESLVFIVPLGLVVLAFGAALLRGERSGFAWGIAVPCFVLGAALVATGGFVAARTPAQLSSLTALHASDPARFVAEELPRMQKVNASWPIYLGTWCIFLVVGLGLRFLVRRDWATGLGIALLFFGAVGMVIDGFAERRARPYTAALEELAANVARAH